MPIKIIKNRTLPIGLDLGSRMIKMAQMRLVEGNFELLAAESVELPPNCRQDHGRRLTFTCDALRRMLAAGEFAGRKCILSLPASVTFLQHVRIPKLPPDQIAKVVQEEISGKLPYPVEEAVVRHIVAGDVLGDADPKQEVVAIAVSRSVLESYLTMASRARLDVVGVSVEACAIVECFARVMRRASDTARTTLFIDIGATSTQFVLAVGNKIVFARNLAAGGEKIDLALAKSMKITPQAAHGLRQDIASGNSSPQAEEELYRLLDRTLKGIADEMTQCLRYYESIFRNQGVDRAIFVGGQAYDKRLCQAIAQHLNLPAQIGDPLVRVARTNNAGAGLRLDWRQPQPAWAVAVGLSLGPSIAA